MPSSQAARMFHMKRIEANVSGDLQIKKINDYETDWGIR